MLVLTRRVGERIIIAGAIEVTVLSVRGKKVRLGIAAPDAVRVDRQEIHEGRGPFPPQADDSDEPALSRRQSKPR